MGQPSKSVLEQRIEKLKETTRQLTNLLENPQPGLFSWLEAVPARVEELQAILKGERD